MNVPPSMKSQAAPPNFDSQGLPPSYEDACSSSNTETRSPQQTQYRSLLEPESQGFVPSRQLPIKSTTSRRRGAHPQNYSSLLPDISPGEQASPGLSPNYNQVTSSIPEDSHRRWYRSDSSERGWGHRHRGFRWGSSKPKCPPKPEGVPLESVCDRFGNRKREIKWRSRGEIMRDPPSIRAALRNVRM